jgi:hypothetical protein
MLQKQMLEIGQHQFLMLLFVMKAELEAIEFIRIRTLTGPRGQKCNNRPIDVLTVVHNFTETRPCEEPASGAGILLANRIVVGVKEVFESLIKNLVWPSESLEKKRFERPRGMGEMPFCWRRIRHGLSLHVFAGEPLTERFTAPADGNESAQELRTQLARIWLVQKSPKKI